MDHIKQRYGASRTFKFAMLTIPSSERMRAYFTVYRVAPARRLSRNTQFLGFRIIPLLFHLLNSFEQIHVRRIVL